MDQLNLIDYSHLTLFIPNVMKYSDFEFLSKIQWQITDTRYELIN